MRQTGIPILLMLAAAMVLASCTTYGYSLVTYNETTASIREHEVLGNVMMEIHPTGEMWKEDKGIRALLLEEARSLYGDDVDDVVNVATSQGTSSGTYVYGYILIQGDAIRYTGGER